MVTSENIKSVILALINRIKNETSFQLRHDKEVYNLIRYVCDNNLFKTSKYNELKGISDPVFNKAKNGDPLLSESQKRKVFKLLAAFVDDFMALTIDFNLLPDNDPSQYIISTNKKRCLIPQGFFSFKIDKANLSKFGLTNVLDSEPIQLIEKDLQKATKFRMLISRVREWEKWHPILRNFAARSDTKEIQLLLGRPYSPAIELRGKTLKSDIGITDFSKRISLLLSQIINKITEDDVLNKKLNIRIFSFPCTISVYQCLGKENQLLSSYFGVFWNHKSSLDAPHICIKGKTPLSECISEHFEKTWKSNIKVPFYQENPISWKEMFDKENTIPVPNNLSQFEQLKQQLFEWQQYQKFHNPIEKEEKKVFFKAFYFGTRQIQYFRLSIDQQNKRIYADETRSGSPFSGVFYDISSSINILMCNQEPTNRISLIQLLIGANQIDKKEFIIGNYSNISSDEGMPYSKHILLFRIDNTQESYQEKKLAPHYIPFLEHHQLNLEDNYLEIKKIHEDSLKDSSLVSSSHISRHLFNSSCYFASKEDIPNALNTLKEAFQRGFNDKITLKNELNNGFLSLLLPYVDIGKLELKNININE